MHTITDRKPTSACQQPWRADQNDETGAVFLKRFGGQIVAEFDRTPTALADASDIAAKLNKAEAPAGDEVLALSLLRQLVDTFSPGIDRDEDVCGSDAVGWLADFVPKARKALQVNPLRPLSIAYVGIGVVQGLDGLPDAQYRALMDRAEGQLVIVEEAIAAARDHDIDSHECDGCHAYDVAEQFGIDFVETQVAQLAEAAAGGKAGA